MTKKTNLKTMLAVTACFFAGQAYAAEIAANAALMQAMDKVTGRVNKITVPVNSKVSYGDFSLVLRACKKRPAEETPENFAFVDVTDKSFGTDEYNIFRGWLLSSAPGINAIEHPIYDIWLLECIDTEIDETTLLSEEELKARDNLPAKQSLQKEQETEEINTDNSSAKTKKVIHIREFINEDRDIEKDIPKAPAYISESSASYVSEIEEGDEPENLLLFTKMQESGIEEKSVSKPAESVSDDDLSDALDAELSDLQKN